MKKFPLTPHFIPFCIGLLLVGIRLWGLVRTGLPDYDACKNWLILRDMVHGDFSLMFHHASPTFYLFFLPFAYISINHIWLQFINILIQVAALWKIYQFFDKIKENSPTNTLMIVSFLLVGTCSFLVYSARSIAIESLSLLVFAYWLKAFWQKDDNKTALFFALLLSVNYKTMLLIPVMLVLRPFLSDLWLKIVVTTFATIIGLICIGFVLGVPIYTYPKALYITVIIKNVNPYKSINQFEFDVLYYVRYLLDFEPVLAYSIALAIICKLYEIIKKKNYFFVFFKNLINNPLIIGILFFVGMSLLQKAPRGLLWAYPIIGFSVFTFLTDKMQKIIKNRFLFYFIIIGLTIVQLFFIQKNIWQFAHTSYSQIASFLPSDRPIHIVTTSSLQIAPFLPSHVKITPCHSLACLDSLQYKADYMLQDEFYKALKYDFYEKYPFGLFNKITCKQETSLKQPYLYLEHSEFSGINYAQTIQLITDKPFYICLYQTSK